MTRFAFAGLALLGGLVLLGAASSSEDRGGNGVRADRETVERTTDESPQPRWHVDVTPEMSRHSRIRNALYFVGTAWGIGILVLVLGAGWSRGIRDRVASRVERPFLAAMAYFALFTILAAILSFPLDLYSGFIVPHQFDLSNQSFAEWLWEGAKALVVSIVIGAPLAAVVLRGIARMPRRWWLALWAGGIPVSIFIVILAPVVVEPLFNDFRRLENRGLEARLLELARRAGIEGSDVFEVDKSKQTKTMNAYVTGLGPSKRIVMWDTLLAQMEDDEVVFVMAHEMGHYVKHHLWKGLAFGTALMFGVLWLGHRIVEWGTRRWGPKWGFAAASDPAALPWLLIVLSSILFLLSPVLAGFSRHFEHEADIFALELTGLNEDAAAAFAKFARSSKVDPQPHRMIEFWRYSHPPLADRIDFALSYGSEKDSNPRGRDGH